jgi:hypothetical protein
MGIPATRSTETASAQSERLSQSHGDTEEAWQNIFWDGSAYALGGYGVTLGSSSRMAHYSAAQRRPRNPQVGIARPLASQASAAKRRSCLMQWRRCRANGAAAARRPYLCATSALTRGSCSGVSVSDGRVLRFGCHRQPLQASFTILFNDSVDSCRS